MKAILVTFIISALQCYFTGAIPLQFVTRAEWDARPATNNPGRLDLPVTKVIISHTATEECSTKTSCIRTTRIIQDFHMDARLFFDIAYNFLIGGDGLIYEGRGWAKEGAHTKGHNKDSIGIAFIGTFNSKEPTREQLQAAQLLLEEGVSVGILSSDYKLFGHRQLTSTTSPGHALYEIIKKWPHWSEVSSM